MRLDFSSVNEELVSPEVMRAESESHITAFGREILTPLDFLILDRLYYSKFTITGFEMYKRILGLYFEVVLHVAQAGGIIKGVKVEGIKQKYEGIFDYEEIAFKLRKNPASLKNLKEIQQLLSGDNGVESLDSARKILREYVDAPTYQRIIRALNYMYDVGWVVKRKIGNKTTWAIGAGVRKISERQNLFNELTSPFYVENVEKKIRMESKKQ